MSTINKTDFEKFRYSLNLNSASAFKAKIVTLTEEDYFDIYSNFIGR